MIDGVFESALVGADDEIFKTKCRKCEHTFEVDMNFVRPKNCKYIVGESLTITCPNCKAEGVTLEKDAQRIALERKIKDLDKTIKEIDESVVALFDTCELPTEENDFSVFVKCPACRTSFKIAVKEHFTNMKIDGDKLIISCPNCKLYEGIDRTEAVKRISRVGFAVHLEDLKEKLKEFNHANEEEKEGHGKEAEDNKQDNAKD